MTWNQASYIKSKISTLAFQIFAEGAMSGHSLTMDEATKIAIKQVAAEERLKKHSPQQQPSKGNEHPSLLGKLQEMAARMAAAGRRPVAGDSLMTRLAWFLYGSEEPEPQPATAESNAPTVTVTTTIKSKLADVVVNTEPQQQQLAPPASPEPAYPLIYTASGLSGAQLIPDEEFPATLTSSATHNWRASIAWNEQQRKRNRR
jgi:hypothetical protein